MDLYGGLLTDRQRQFVLMHYEEDLVGKRPSENLSSKRYGRMPSVLDWLTMCSTL